MALSLVVTSDIPGYQRGDIITDQDEIDTVRAGEYAAQAVIVSDEAIPPPAPPPPGPDFAQLQAAYQALAAADRSTAQQLAAANATNQQQSQTIAAQDQKLAQQDAAIGDLNRKVSVLAAVVEQGGGGTGTGPTIEELADDVPLAEADGVVLRTVSGRVLVGDAPRA